MKIEDQNTQFKNIAGSVAFGAAGAALALRRGRMPHVSGFADRFELTMPFRALTGTAAGVAGWHVAQAALKSSKVEGPATAATRSPWRDALASAGIVGGSTLAGTFAGAASAGADPATSGTFADGLKGLHRLPKAFLGGAIGLGLASAYLARSQSEPGNDA